MHFDWVLLHVLTDVSLESKRWVCKYLNKHKKKKSRLRAEKHQIPEGKVSGERERPEKNRGR